MAQWADRAFFLKENAPFFPDRYNPRPGQTRGEKAELDFGPSHPCSRSPLCSAQTPQCRRPLWWVVVEFLGRESSRIRGAEAGWCSRNTGETSVMGAKWAKWDWRRWGQTWGSLTLIVFLIRYFVYISSKNFHIWFYMTFTATHHKLKEVYKKLSNMISKYRSLEINWSPLFSALFIKQCLKDE